MSYNRIALALLLLFLSLSARADELSSVDHLKHLGPFPVRERRQVELDTDTWFRTGTYLPFLSADQSRYAIAVEATSGPSSGEYIAVRSLVGKPEVLLNPRPDNDVSKGTVRMAGDPYLYLLTPCDWSADGGQLLVAGGNLGGPRSIWRIDLQKMRGSHVSPLLSTETDTDASFSPDGKKVAYVSNPVRRDRQGDTSVSDNPRESRIVVADASGVSANSIGAGLRAAWAPDSRRLLVATLDRLWIVDTVSRKRSLIFPVKQPGHAKYPVYITRYARIAGRRRRIVWFDSIGWLDDSHLVVTAVASRHDYRDRHSVWILDTLGRIIQAVPSADLYQAAPLQRSLVLTAEHPDRKGETWLVKY